MNTIKIPHTLELLTTIDLDKMSPSIKVALLSMSLEQQQNLLAGMAKEILQTNSIDKANEGNSWAFLEVK
jgi:hypothetical protein